MTRRGALLTEALVAATLAALVMVMGLAGLAGLQRLVQGQAERSAALSAGVAGLQTILAELRDASPGSLIVLERDRVVYRAERGVGIACGLGADGVLVPTGRFRAFRLPVPGRDSLELLLAAGESVPRWVTTGVAAPPRASRCPDGRPALAIPPDPAWAGPVPDGTALRVRELMELRAYRSGGSTWLGARSVSGGETTQPVAGPLAPDGFSLRYLDADGWPAAAIERVARIAVTLRPRPDAWSAVGGAASGRGGPSADSLSFMVILLNRH